MQEEKESMGFKHEDPGYLVEISKNKLFITGYPSHSYIVKDWQAVNVIHSQVHANYNFFVMPLPGFDEETYPFLALCGEKQISIINVKTCIQKPLIEQEFRFRYGL
jgi:hypothetical protein